MPDSDSVLRHSSSDLKRMGRRIFVFIAGGATRSEVLRSFNLEFILMLFFYKKKIKNLGQTYSCSSPSVSH